MEYEEFIIFNLAVKKMPYKIAFIIKFMSLPSIIKNYGLGIIEIGYL